MRGKFGRPEVHSPAMRPSPPSETETLRLGLEEIRRRLPVGWKVDATQEPRKATTKGLRVLDALLRLKGPDGKCAEIAIEVKSDGSPRTTRSALQQLRSWDSGAAMLFVAPFLPRRSREIAEEAGANYADLTGNIRLAISRPALFLRDCGANTNPYPGKEVERSLGGASAARVILWICQLKPPITRWLLTEVAKGSGVSLAYVSRLTKLLEREDLIRREPRGPILETDRPGLVRRWAQDFDLLRTNRSRLYLDPRGAKRALDALGTTGFQRQQIGRIAVTGSFAANRYAPIATPSKLVCYVSDIEVTARALDLSPATTTGNVFLLSPYDEIVFDTVYEGIPGPGKTLIPMAAPAQIAVDCLTGPDRMPEEGEALLAWLQKKWDGWKGFGSKVQA